MNEHAILVLLGIAGVAATFSGFSGVVAVFGGRAEGKWATHERFRMTNMLILSLGACIFSFVPLIEELFQISDQILWLSSSVLLGAFSVYHFAYATIAIRKLRLLEARVLNEKVRIIFFTCLGLSIGLQLLNAAGLWIARGPGSFIAGLVFLLIPAALQFALLVLEPIGSPVKK